MPTHADIGCGRKGIGPPGLECEWLVGHRHGVAVQATSLLFSIVYRDGHLGLRDVFGALPSLEHPEVLGSGGGLLTTMIISSIVSPDRAE
ncbi:hypothetical protein [Cupriavidus consociatus]|uniref:hypothetical protein n=1 Tax=Cupriavidus consociatus TaxID=2821357 RepID=UPI001AE31E09|nr:MULTISPECIES: hypothetical protein [unclassified Cupriavidus]MBP0623159.1 hypothetical protein [Cupriavidus sp. LEh25]MDK2659853.1 hypothetical protein [Cupriavidus sp. LEh21]